MKNTPTPAARKLLRSLEAMAERGINGERDNAIKKLARLKARYDFAMPDKGETDLLNFPVQRAPYSSDVCTIPEPDIAVAVKWVFENKFGVSCRLAGDRLLAEVTPATAKNMRDAAITIAGAFRELWDRFYLAGAERGDRNCFFQGLWEGLMRQEREAGQPLPTRALRSLGKGKKGQAPRLAVHPYSVAVGLGRQIRFNANLNDIKNELENTVKGQLT